MLLAKVLIKIHRLVDVWAKAKLRKGILETEAGRSYKGHWWDHSGTKIVWERQKQRESRRERKRWREKNKQNRSKMGKKVLSCRDGQGRKCT